MLSSTSTETAFRDATSSGRYDAGWFLAGKRVNLGSDLTRRLLEEGLPVWRWSAASLIVRARRDVGRPGYLLPLRDRRRPWRVRQAEFRPPFNGYGFLFAVRRSDL